MRISNLIFTRPLRVQRMSQPHGLFEFVAVCYLNEFAAFELL